AVDRARSVDAGGHPGSRAGGDGGGTVMEAAIAALIAQYHAGLEAELALLQRLEGIAARQREASEDGDMDALGIAGDERDQAMSALVVIEHELKPIRLELVAMREELKEVPAFEAVAA